MTTTYQLGLLHIVYTLINVDGRIDEREINSLQKIQEEEEIDSSLFREFSRSIVGADKNEIYRRGVELLNACNEEERLCAFVHLFRLAESDASISLDEVRHLLMATKGVKIDFEDVIMSAHLAAVQLGGSRNSAAA